MTQRRFTSYSRYLTDLLGGRMQKVTIDAGFSCPNRDGSLSSEGCTFCNNSAFSPAYTHSKHSITEQINEGIEFHSRRYARATGYLAYFQSYSNTHRPLAQLKLIYNEAIAHPAISGLVIGTRPDCVDSDKLDYFASLARDRYVIIEYGIESVYNSTLQAINRHHDFATARQAIEQTAARGIHTGAHMIIGLPGESRQMLIDQCSVLNALPLNTIKFHQLQLFKNTAMARDYERDPSAFSFYTLDEYLDLFIDILERLRPDLVIERFAGEAPPRFQLLPSPWGAVRNERLVQLLEARLLERDTYQGRLYREE